MKTTRQFIEWLRDTADNLEIALEDGEITNELNYQPNTYGIGMPYIATYNGFIDIDNPSKIIEDK
ncbi:MAG: hypothetical protein ACI4N3_01615 [Alphaproteobacteria bacterium]